MPVEFKLPDLGEGIHEGEIIEILVRIGDRVEDGQPVLVVETDKASAEVPAPVNGTVLEIRVKPGQTVRVGEILMVFLREGESEGVRPPEKPAAKATPEAGVETRPPVLKEEPQERVAEIAPKTTPKAEAQIDRAPVAPAGAAEGPVPAAPSTRRLARELGVDLHHVSPSGPGGRVTPEDVRAAAEGAKKPAAPKPAPEPEQRPLPSPVAPPLPQFDQIGPIERTPLRSIRRATARHMALSWSQIPHVTHMDAADITDLEKFRRKYAKRAQEQGSALSLTVFMLKAATSALRKFPRFNSSLDTNTDEIILKHYYNIGVAVDTERGLIVPVIRGVDRKSLIDLGIELKQTADKARQGKTAAEDLTGGSFTITNIGPLGGASFNPIINYPQVAILGMAQARLQPVVLGDENKNQIVPRLMLPLIITFDHRVIDGADAARFLNTIIESLKNPENLMMVM